MSLTPKVVCRTVVMVSSSHCFSCIYYMLATHVALDRLAPQGPNPLKQGLTALYYTELQVLRLETKMQI